MSPSSMARVGASKAQVSLYKIIAVISTVAPPPPLPNLKEHRDLDDAAVAVDLSQRLGQTASPAESAAAEGKSSEGEYDQEKIVKADVGGNETSEIIDQEEEGGGGDQGGYLDVLLEAVWRVSEEEEEKVSGRGSKKRVIDVEAAAAEAAAPVVRSKRGRNQCLPSRYRDSVIEQWAKPPTVHRHGRSRRTRP